MTALEFSKVQQQSSPWVYKSSGSIKGIRYKSQQKYQDSLSKTKGTVDKTDYIEVPFKSHFAQRPMDFKSSADVTEEGQNTESTEMSSYLTFHFYLIDF